MIVELIENQTLTRPIGMMGNIRNVHFESIARCFQKETLKEKTASNGRFGVMAAVTPQKGQCEFESLYPAGSLVEAATTPSRWDVSGNAGATVRHRSKNRKVEN